MKIKRTYKPALLKFGRVDIVDESVARLVFGQTMIAHHKEGECPDRLCHYCAEPAMRRLTAGKEVETYFAKWQLAEA